MDQSHEFRCFLDEVEEINSKINAAGKLYTEFIDECMLKSRESFRIEDSTSRKEKNRGISEKFNQLAVEIQEEVRALSMKIRERGTPQMHYHIKGLSDRTKRIIDSYGSAEQRLLKKERENQRSQYLVAKPLASREELEQLDDEEIASTLIEAAYTMSSKEAIEKVQDAEKRSKNIFKIMKEIERLNEIGRSLQLIIYEAERELTGARMASHVTTQNTEGTNVEMDSIRIRRRKNRTVKLVMLAIMLILGIVLLRYVIKIVYPMLPKK